MLRRVVRERSVRAAFFAFTLTRAIVFVVFVLATHVTVVDPSTDDSSSHAQNIGQAQNVGQVKNIRISVFPETVRDKIGALALRGDGGWYIGVARNGYEQRVFETDTVHNWAFFPLYPVAIRAAASVTGGFQITAMLISNLFLLFALVLLHKTVVAFGYDEGTADRAVFYTAAFPVSYFFSLPMSESLFLLLTVGSIWAARCERWWLAAAFGALAAATRYNGLFLLPVLTVMYFQYNRPFKLRANVLGLLLIPLGLLPFMLYLFHITGNAFAFVGIQKAWGVRSGFFLTPLFNYLASVYDVSLLWNFRTLNFASAIAALACGCWLLKRREWALALYTFVSVIVPLSTSTLESMSRYVLVVFPVFIMLAVAGRRLWIDQAIRAVFVVLLGLLSAAFALYLSIAII